MCRPNEKINYWLGMNARRLRIKNHLTQREVADYLHISRGNYSNKEALVVGFAPGDDQKLAKFYGVKVERLYKPCIMPPEKQKQSIVYKTEEARKEADIIIQKIARLRKKLERLKWLEENKDVYW